MDCITVEVVRRPHEAWGIQISGEAPCYIEKIKSESPAEEAGLEVGDCILTVNGMDAYNVSHDEVVQMISDSGRIVRFKLLPNNNNNNHEDCVFSANEDAFWTNEDESILKCQLPEENSVINNNATEESFKYSNKPKSKTPRRDKFEKIEQDTFIVTEEKQREFDKQCSFGHTFEAKKASVSGDLNGKTNRILGESKRDVRGIKSRVKSVVQHFSVEEEQEKVCQEDRGKIIIYTTGLGIHRDVAKRCEHVRQILKGFRVKYEDRDIFASSEHKDELYQKLGLDEGAPFPEMPRVYIGGVYIGGSTEMQNLSDCGDLRIKLSDFPKYNARSACPTCKTSGFVTCRSCKGKAYRTKNRFAVLKCATCSQSGYLSCPDCC